MSRSPWALLTALAISAPSLAAQSARVEIGPVGQGLTASTYGTGSFVVENLSATDRITKIRLDLGTALLPDLVFDPFGTGGDVVSKPFIANSGKLLVGVGPHAYLEPNGGGYDVLEVEFTDFDPGETFSFSIDVDPSSIQGSNAPGPGESGSVSGLELTGSTITLEFDGGAVATGETFRQSGSLSASEVWLGAPQEVAPSLELTGFASPGKAFLPDWTARVTGIPGRTVSLLVLEGALYTDGVPGGGFDLDLFEANTVVAVDEHSAVLDGSGQADIPITLLETVAEGGIAHLVAVQDDGAGGWSAGSNRVVADFDAVTISFNKYGLQSVTLNDPTSLQFGPDGRLYVAEQLGLIRVLTIQENPGNYKVIAEETISLVRDIPNHDDDGTPNPGLTTRQVTGLLVTGTASAPVIYVGSSDSRIGGGGSGTDKGLDTNSGVISRITMGPSGWERHDLVRGLPRSEENHAVNGMQLDPSGDVLYLAVGGNTNMGAPSHNFAMLPEFALSAAILSIDLAAIGETTYDLPTLDDEDRSGTADMNDPFGGNNGKNQARLVAGGPVQVYSPGWRNIYDLVITSSGRMYGVDNGPNGGWGDVPVEVGGVCTNQVAEPGVTHHDNLHFVAAPGYYAGHPNPTRANGGLTFNASNPQSPVDFANPIECEYREPGVDDGALVTWPASTNGIVEYRSSAFGGAMLGDLLLVSLDKKITRVKLNAAGDDTLLVDKNFGTAGGGSLDITAQGDGEPFAGSIWVANHGGDFITVFRPVDVSGCSGVDSAGLDEDQDGYSNADEIDNGTDPCSSASTPSDEDMDGVSDRNDADDDDDGIPDTMDPFALDPDNGLTTFLPIRFLWENDQDDLGGLLELGFTGLMTNGLDDYADLFDATNMTAGGAAGAVTVDLVPGGTADGATNDQAYAFQVGMHVTPVLPRFLVSTRVLGPFMGITPDAQQSMGVFLGTGGQDDFFRLSVTGAGLEFRQEVAGASSQTFLSPLTLPGPGYVDLLLEVDPAAATVRPWYELDDGNGPVALGTLQALPADWFDGTEALAVGILASSGSAPAFPATWDRFEVQPLDDFPVAVRANAGGGQVASVDDGPDWSADGGFVSGSTGTFTSGSAIGLHSSVPEGTPTAVFQSERYVSGGSQMDYAFPLSSGKEYLVRLYFAEIWSGGQSVGARVFDVEIEDALVLDDYDIYADVGGYTGVMKSFLVNLIDDQLDISFLSEEQNAKVSAIEIVELQALPTTPGSVVLYGLTAGGVNLGHLDMSAVPRIGQPTSALITSMGDAPAAILFWAAAPGSLKLLGGTALVDPFSIILNFPVGLSGGSATLPMDIPDVPSLVGRTLYLQAAGIDLAAIAGWRFTNGVEMTIGN